MRWGGGYEGFFYWAAFKTWREKFFNQYLNTVQFPPHVSVFKTKLDPPTDTQFFCTISFEIVLLRSDTRVYVWKGVRSFENGYEVGGG